MAVRGPRRERAATAASRRVASARAPASGAEGSSAGRHRQQRENRPRIVATAKAVQVHRPADLRLSDQAVELRKLSLGSGAAGLRTNVRPRATREGTTGCETVLVDLPQTPTAPRSEARSSAGLGDEVRGGASKRVKGLEPSTFTLAMGEEGADSNGGEDAETTGNVGDSAPAEASADRASPNARAIAWNETADRVRGAHDPRIVAALAGLLSRLATLATVEPLPGVGTGEAADGA